MNGSKLSSRALFFLSPCVTVCLSLFLSLIIIIICGALGAVSKRLDTWLDNLGITIRAGLLQKTALLRTA